MTVGGGSLFNKSAEPVVGAASQWTLGVLGGSLASSLCVIAIAILGFLLLTGRLGVRRSAEVVLGCFLLLGAGLLAGQLQKLAGAAGWNGAERDAIIQPQPEPPHPPPSANYDPYAGASLRRDR